MSYSNIEHIAICLPFIYFMSYANVENVCFSFKSFSTLNIYIKKIKITYFVCYISINQLKVATFKIIFVKLCFLVFH